MCFNRTASLALREVRPWNDQGLEIEALSARGRRSGFVDNLASKGPEKDDDALSE